MSLFTSFNTGVSGIRTAQAGLNTAGHNLANTSTVGYTRQQNILTDTYYRTLKVNWDGKQQIGYGSTVAQIRQIRDMFLDKEYRVQTSRMSFYEQQYTTAMEVEDVLGELEGVEFNNSLEYLWDSLESLSMNPQDIVNRNLFISEADAFIKNAKDVYQALVNYQINLNKEISSQVQEINLIGEKISALNQKIAEAEASDLENANDYRDARNQLMDELASYTYYTYNEDANGRVSIFINNAPFVSEFKSYHMGTELINTKEYNEKTGQYEVVSVSEMLKVVWLDNGYDDEVYDLDRSYSYERKTDTGSLLGILTARGNRIANYTDIPVKPQKSKYTKADGTFDQLQYDIAMNQYQEDLELYNNTTGNSILTKTQAQFDQLIRGVVQLINDAFCPNITQDLTGITGRDAKGQTIKLDGQYKILDVINCAVGTDDDVTIGTEVFSRKATDRYQILTLKDQVYGTDAEGNQIALAQKVIDAEGNASYRLYVYNEEDPEDLNNLYTLMNLQVNPDLVEDYALLPVKLNPELGESGGYNTEVIEKILSGWNEEFAVLDPNTETAYSINDYYRSMVTVELGAQGEIWKSMLEHQEKEVDGIEDKRQQVMGVSSEEEMVELLKYQHAYNAASRYISVIDAMLEHLIERLG